MEKILAINAGSSTLKWQLFEMPVERVIAKGMIDRLGLPDSVFTVKYGDQKKYKSVRDIATHEEAGLLLLTQLKELKIVAHLDEITGVGHRVVAGGEVFKDSTVINPVGLDEINRLAEYAPLHNPTQAYYIKIFTTLLPGVPEVAVFDTSFYSTLPAENYLYSIPQVYYEKYGARKYGAHGTSHRFVAHRAAEILEQPLETQKMITLHLGSGASITAIQDGYAVDTSMGFTPLAGITMGTRSGDIDVSLVAFLAEKLGKTMPEMITILNHKSGLLGLSELSPDMRDLEETAESRPQSQLALDIFVNRVVKYVGSYVALMNGVDTLVFTAGSGENGSELRAAICEQLACFGVVLDEDKNNVRSQERIISSDQSRVKVLIVPTNEELMIARDVMRLK
ncbi:acetate/propionate family kinase [Latilactobacillus graminis]|uniref:Acetate kinase n=2 Tax=Latilactobacillus graminis TaxID=60519 RepID=A0AA89I5J0_9LACO|nr:acetate kinase [Latilactobacillus graminis]KRM23614.1 acetate kinase [Latilactobacillus graminis DSM 20719]QFP80193.1 acetate kinase [Latilactobacillus graminis]